MVLDSTSWRLTAAGISHVEAHYDLSNAFMTPEHSAYDTTAQELYSEANQPLVRSLYKQAHTIMETADEEAELRLHGSPRFVREVAELLNKTP